MWIYLLCFLAGIGLFYGLPRAFRALGIRRVGFRFVAEFYPSEDSVKKIETDYDKHKKLSE